MQLPLSGRRHHISLCNILTVAMEITTLLDYMLLDTFRDLIDIQLVKLKEVVIKHFLDICSSLLHLPPPPPPPISPSGTPFLPLG